MRDVRRLAREAIPLTSRPSLSRHLLFTKENMVKSQEASFVQSDEQRSEKQEVRVLAPRLKKPSERKRAELQSLLDLTDWRGLHFIGGNTNHPFIAPAGEAAPLCGKFAAG
jgi:hypothetical protein